MKLLRAFGRALSLIFAFIGFLTLWLVCAFLIDVYVLDWFGAPTGDGIGIGILGLITVIVLITFMEYDMDNDR